jgi:ferredoxin
MLDKRLIAEQADAEIEAVIEEADSITVSGAGKEIRLAKSEFLQANCRICTHRNPVIFDELAADAVVEQSDMDRYEDIRHIEAMLPEKRKHYFDDLLSRCIRCYACRNACPLCYCPTCFVDEARPQWVGKSQDHADILTFHFLRAYHCAGRCTDCGACERACPVGIEVRLLTKKLEKDCLELFDWEAGLSVDQRPPLDIYRPDDQNDFIK